jgi:hypothetical protein
MPLALTCRTCQSAVAIEIGGTPRRRDRCSSLAATERAALGVYCVMYAWISSKRALAFDRGFSAD